MTLSIHHIAINAQAPETLSALYERAVGFERVAGPGPALWLAAPTAYLAFHQATQARPVASEQLMVSDQGIGHFCIQSSEGEQTWEALAAQGITFNAAMTSLGGNYLYAYGRDPEGNLIEVEGMTMAAEPGPPWMAHVALVSSDIEATSDFYARLIGRAPHNGGTFTHPAFKAITGHDDVNVTAKWIMTDNLIFELWHYHHPLTQPAAPPPLGAQGYRHIGFCCANLDREWERVSALGIILSKNGDGELPDILGPSLSGADPDGNRFLILQSPDQNSFLSLASLASPSLVADRHRHILNA